MRLDWRERIRLAATLPRIAANRDKIVAALREAAADDREPRSIGLALVSRFPELEGIALLLRSAAGELASIERHEEIQEVLETAAGYRLAAILEAVFPPEAPLQEGAGSAGWAHYLLQLAQRRDERSLRQRIERLGSVSNPELEDGRRAKVLGNALEMALETSKHRDPEAVSCLLAAWVLSDDRHLEGPSFAEILEQDPDGFCGGVEALLLMTDRSPWEKLLEITLAEAWKAAGSSATVLQRHLEGWLLYFWPSGLPADSSGSSNNRRALRRPMRLQWLALTVLGHRPKLELLRPLCRYAAAFFRSKSTTAWRYGYLAREQAGFLMRWSYGETALARLEEIAVAPSSTASEIEAARVLAESLWQAKLPPALQPKPRPELPNEEELTGQKPSRWQPLEDLAQGRSGFLAALSTEDFLKRDWPSGIADLAGDPSVPDLARADLDALNQGLDHVVKSARVHEDLAVSGEDSVFEAWAPWLARLDPIAWMDVLTLLIDTGLGYDRPQNALAALPVLGSWPTGSLATHLEATVLRATHDGGEVLAENWGVLRLMRIVVHLEDPKALFRCLEALSNHEEHAKICEIRPLPEVLEWVLDREIFQAAGRRRVAASRDTERRFWFFIEMFFGARRLPQEEALAWWAQTLPVVEIPEKVASYVASLLLRIDDDRAAETLVNDDRLRALLAHDETQLQILHWARERQCSERLGDLFPGLAESLSLANRGIYLNATGRTEDLRRWGYRVFHALEEPSSNSVGLAVTDPLTWSRQALEGWANLEPESFLRNVREFFGSLKPQLPRNSESSGVLEAVLLAWQQLKPLEAHAQRTRLRIDSSFSYDSVPVHLHALWDTARSNGLHHRTLRLQLLGSCPSDKGIAMHAFAARLNGSIGELDEIANQLLASETQLDRTLAVSLLAWHPQGEERLEPYTADDPSLWVRQHARWAREVARYDRLGRDLFRAALCSNTWLEQQAQLRQLVPLVLPTFEIWAYNDEELGELTLALSPRRKALLIDFRYKVRQSIRWNRICRRNLDSYCRGEDIKQHLSAGDTRPPWPSGTLEQPGPSIEREPDISKRDSRT